MIQFQLVKEPDKNILASLMKAYEDLILSNPDIAVCMMAGVPMDYKMESKDGKCVFTVTTKNKVGIVRTPTGIRIYIQGNK